MNQAQQGHWIEVARHDAPAGLGATPRKMRGQWYAASPDGRRTFRWAGLGALTDILSQAQAVVSYFQTNPCSRASVPVVSTFQSAYNGAGGAGRLTVDGQYGGNTQAALQEVLNAAVAGGSGPAQQAPANCFSMAVPSVPATDQPQGGGGSSAAMVSSAAPMDWTPWLVGGGVAALLGTIGYAVWAKKHHRR